MKIVFLFFCFVLNAFAKYPTYPLSPRFQHFAFGLEPHIPGSSLRNFVISFSADGALLLGGRIVPPQSTLIYIMDEDGHLYGAVEPTRFNHSSFFDDMPLAAAGMLRTDVEGKIEIINNDSGHFKPDGKCLDSVKTEFEKRKLHTSIMKMQDVATNKDAADLRTGDLPDFFDDLGACGMHLRGD